MHISREIIRKAPRGAVAALGLAVILSSCAGRPGPETLAPIADAEFKPVKVEALYAVTTRDRARPGENVFTSAKARGVNYAGFDVSIPPSHKATNIEWPKGSKVNPQTDFAVVRQSVLERDAMLDAVVRETGKGVAPTVFVHGYNYNFQESLYRLAQLKTDSDIDGPPILFSWPSHAAIPAYVADKESATYSRDALAQLLVDLTARTKSAEVEVFAHSMGGWLTVEALRQLKLQGRDDVLRRLRVILAAPDIDADVFISQLQVIGPMRNPIVILVSPDDRALKVSSILGAGAQRVGAVDVHDPRVAEAAKQAGVNVIDISSLASLDPSNHNRYVEAAALAKTLGKPAANAGFGDAGAFIFDAAAQTISSPFSLAATVLRGN